MKASETLKEIWRIKENLSKEINGMTTEEMIEFFEKNRPEWANELLVTKSESTKEDNGPNQET